MSAIVLPNTPQPGTGLTVPLVSVANYQQFTGDTTTDEGEVTQAIYDAIETISKECVRTFAYGQYVEDLYLYAKGLVYPSATPIDPGQAITSAEQGLYNPATDNALGEGSIIQGAGIWVGWFTPLPWMPVWTGVIPPQTIITYYGGYQPYGTTNGPTPQLPAKLARAICTMAYYELHPTFIVPMGQSSSNVGGVDLSGRLSSALDRDPNLKRIIRRFRRPQAYAWHI